MPFEHAIEACAFSLLCLGMVYYILHITINFFFFAVEKLDLLLCFVDFNTGWKVVVTLDMTCLNR